MKETVEGWKTVQVRDLCDLGRGRVISNRKLNVPRGLSDVLFPHLIMDRWEN